MASPSLVLALHGVPVRVVAPRRVLSDLAHDFHCFAADREAPDEAPLEIGVRPAAECPWRKARPWARIAGRAWLPGPRGEQRRIYFGAARVSYRFAARRCEIYCDDPAVAYEVVYIVLSSYLGERLDRMGLHRVHGLGLAVGGDGLLVLAPSGAGKSTLAMACLGRERVRFLSDDTPLVGQDAVMRAYPQRIGLRERPVGDATPARAFPRARYGVKYVVGGGVFASQVAAAAPVRWIALLRPERGDTPRIARCGKARLVLPLLRWLVVGHETPQMAELFLRASARDLFAKIAIALSRARAALAIVRSAEAVVVRPARDPAATVDALEALARAPRLPSPPLLAKLRPARL